MTNLSSGYNKIKDFSQAKANYSTLSEWGNWFASDTWQRIGFCRQVAHFNLHEVTITQNLLFSFWQLALHSQLPVQLYKARDEKTNGNDLEIAIQTDMGFVLFPSQAKMLAVNNRYKSINRCRNGVYQIDRLLAYAHEMGGFPLYLFYNFCTDIEAVWAILEKHKISIDTLGCSVCPATVLKNHFFDTELKKWRIPRFYAMHNLFYSPLSLFLLAVGQSFERLQSLFGIGTGILRFYTEAELTNKKLWTDLAPGPAIGRINPTARKIDSPGPKVRESASFQPKFRILLTSRRRGATIYRN